MEFKVLAMIAKLDSEICKVNDQIAYTESRIDTLECYQNHNSELDELNEKLNELEEQKMQLIAKKEKYEEMLNGRKYTETEIIDNIKGLSKIKEILISQYETIEQDNEQKQSLLDQIISIDMTLRFFNKKLEEIEHKKIIK